jgi:hypothetical protein
MSLDIISDSDDLILLEVISASGADILDEHFSSQSLLPSTFKPHDNEDLPRPELPN